ncbi:hypothetical protein ACFOGI_02880 [Virgibacillus xinjiangensis]|uniref:DUF4181 domain-containing protein n=1 Tax=Virgibacillus xinjiangensis TaxID=393090 RepID=A0ABV7CS95_9BACI
MGAIQAFLQTKEEIYILVYCLIILWINVDYLKEHKQVKEGLAEIDSEDDLEIKPASISFMFIGLIFNFIRRWLIYLLAVFMTENLVVIIIAAILFGVSLYDSVFNYSLEKVRKSNLGFYLIIIDSIFIAGFVLYLFFN